MPPPLKSLISQIAQVLLRKPERQVPTGWWQDEKGISQPPGSYADPSLRRDGRDEPPQSKA